MRVEQIGDCTLYLGDCFAIVPTLQADAVLTDPPYGINIAANPVRQKHKKSDWDASCPTDIELQTILNAAPEQIIWGGNYFSLPATQRFLVWDKVQPENFSLAMCEQAWTNLKGPAKLFRRHVVSYDKSHPTQKPIELMEWCLGFLPNCRTILDPFMGSGTTGVACARAGRAFIGVELDEGYFDIACERIRKAYAQPDMFIERPAPAKQLSMLGGEG